jgi:hypothetical protein
MFNSVHRPAAGGCLSKDGARAGTAMNSQQPRHVAQGMWGCEVLTSEQLTTSVTRFSLNPSAAAALCFSSLYLATSASFKLLLQVALASVNTATVVKLTGMVVLMAAIAAAAAAATVSRSGLCYQR